VKDWNSSIKERIASEGIKQLEGRVDSPRRNRVFLRRCG
jgi:hypothetical protein